MHQFSPGCWWSPTYARHAECRPQNTTTPSQIVTHVTIHTSTISILDCRRTQPGGDDPLSPSVEVGVDAWAGGGGNGWVQATVRRSQLAEGLGCQDSPLTGRTQDTMFNAASASRGDCPAPHVGCKECTCGNLPKGRDKRRRACEVGPAGTKRPRLRRPTTLRALRK